MSGIEQVVVEIVVNIVIIFVIDAYLFSLLDCEFLEGQLSTWVAFNDICLMNEYLLNTTMVSK